MTCRRTAAAIALGLTVLAGGVSAGRLGEARRADLAAVPQVAPPAQRPDYRQVGTASWYGPGFQGRPTASGEPFDQNSLTAAHRTLPLGSQAVVTNIENGRSVVVEINDRGPYVGGRVLDLSRAAAARLGMLDDGLARVRIAATPARTVASTRG
jgi:rare lipoprotein A (peptidoglycan hydrolase)